MPIDKALRKWSGGGYGADKFGLPRDKKFADLSEDEKNCLLEGQKKAEGWFGPRAGPTMASGLPDAGPRQKNRPYHIAGNISVGARNSASDQAALDADQSPMETIL